jgi:hypothetical protein
MITYPEFDRGKARTYAIHDHGQTRWANYREAFALAYIGKPLEVSMYANAAGEFQGFAVHESDGELWTVTNDGGIADKEIYRGRETFDALTATYDQDRAWKRMAAQSNEQVLATRARPSAPIFHP